MSTRRAVRLPICIGLAWLVVYGSQVARAEGEEGTQFKVFPVPGIFWSHDDGAAIDQNFLLSEDQEALRAQVKGALSEAFLGRTGELTKRTAAETFAASFHLTRMAIYSAPKADGNVELHAPITGSIYFTNVLTGDVVFTVTATNAAVEVVSAAEADSAGLKREATKLYRTSLAGLTDVLAKKASATFKPRRIETTVTAIDNGLLVLSGGYRAGFQLGDDLEDDSGGLISVVYSNADYGVARVKLADGVTPGAVFHKVVTGKVDGRLRPRATVLVDKAPEGFSIDYIAEEFSEELGDKAPLTVVQVNPMFASLLQTIVQKADLSSSTASEREIPELLVRLRVGEPIVFESRTNVPFKNIRGYETTAFADIVDTSGRILFTAVGRDLQKVEVTQGLDLAVQARKEISVKNALLALATNLGTLAEGMRDSQTVAHSDSSGIILSSGGRVYPPQQLGLFLRASEIKTGGKTQRLLVPIFDGRTVESANLETHVTALLPLGSSRRDPAAGDRFEVLQLGRAPKSNISFSLCPVSESLGSIRVQDFEDLANSAVGHAMPGTYYMPGIDRLAEDRISEKNGFIRDLKVGSLNPPLCLEAVQRIDASGEECGTLCQRQVAVRVTLRVKSADATINKFGFEESFKSTGYDKSTNESSIANVIQVDLQEETQKLLEAVAAQVTLTTTH